MSSSRWVWVAGPESYGDLDEGDAEALDPASGVGGDGSWWTCHADTRQGDLVVLYRTAPRSDVAYLLEAASDARRLGAVKEDGIVTLHEFSELTARALELHGPDEAPFLHQAHRDYEDALQEVAQVQQILRRRGWRLDGWWHRLLFLSRGQHTDRKQKPCESDPEAEALEDDHEGTPASIS